MTMKPKRTHYIIPPGSLAGIAGPWHDLPHLIVKAMPGASFSLGKHPDEAFIEWQGETSRFIPGPHGVVVELAPGHRRALSSCEPDWERVFFSAAVSGHRRGDETIN